MSKYRLGLLQCDVVPEDLRDRFADYPDMFETAFANSAVDVDWRVYNVLDDQFPAAIDEVDGFITTGARAAVYDQMPWYNALAELIRTIDAAGVPLVGICFGHQAIADALGGEVINSPKGWGIGVHEYKTAGQAAWMSPAQPTFHVPACHQDQIVSLPPGSELLASNAHCENFIVQFSPSSLGVQGHPEFEPEYLDTLIELRREILPEAVASNAKASLHTPHDNITMIRWIANFLKIGSS